MRRYHGRNLAHLLVAVGLPVALLYLRLVFGMLASDSRFTAKRTIFTTVANTMLALFCLAQLICARYLLRLLPASETRVGQASKYVAVLVTCLLLSLAATVVLEAIGFNLFLRAGGLR